MLLLILFRELLSKLRCTDQPPHSPSHHVDITLHIYYLSPLRITARFANFNILNIAVFVHVIGEEWFFGVVKVRSGKKAGSSSLGLSEEAFYNEMSHGLTVAPPPFPANVAIAAVIGSQGSSATVHGNIMQNSSSPATYGAPFAYGYTTGASAGIPFIISQSRHLPPQNIPPNSSQ
ncbi:hypothetical protein M422DRAFT_274261 [Sphaerobolus stellatus SS14]|uniref:Uncharacterized protein n=1 Tax=Sphaerobolus stellatus (strain SS14) TaxID=990650 RepID=A0A0C9U703_SPHS4|nr:hypothetical protein M422DRAFT_274261 [Sphaerobolus stellatus SS14]